MVRGNGFSKTHQGNAGLAAAPRLRGKSGRTRSRRLSCAAALSLAAFALLAAGLIPAQASASANTIFVNGTTGNDTNDCLSSDEACKTIQAAIGKAQADDTITVSSGTYVENLDIDKKLNLECANVGISAGSTPGTRGDETVIQGQADIKAAGTVIDGCQFIRPAGLLIGDRPRLVESVGVSGEIRVQNNIFNLKLDGTSQTQACGSATFGVAAWRIYDNSFSNGLY